ncbi:unnamed protein product [Pleuronectes platessa]|uniref:Uncharacterized protein n=1 Tax=Pleuronectes platessa TaxID=8262 RepID=A0A9N7YX23_PLEPL|nr:unnamed protein product [Pleuronectes platessa]
MESIVVGLDTGEIWRDRGGSAVEKEEGLPTPGAALCLESGYGSTSASSSRLSHLSDSLLQRHRQVESKFEGETTGALALCRLQEVEREDEEGKGKKKREENGGGEGTVERIEE